MLKALGAGRVPPKSSPQTGHPSATPRETELAKQTASFEAGGRPRWVSRGVEAFSLAPRPSQAALVVQIVGGRARRVGPPHEPVVQGHWGAWASDLGECSESPGARVHTWPILCCPRQSASSCATAWCFGVVTWTFTTAGLQLRGPQAIFFVRKRPAGN
jgi:hypothetical protein